MLKKTIPVVFTSLTVLALLTPFWVFKDLLFPYVTSKAFFFRITIELALPFYLYLLLSDSRLRPKLRHPLTIAVLAFLVINVISAFAGVNITRSLWGNFERMGGVYYLAHLTALYFYVLMLGSLGANYIKRFLQVFIGVAMVVTLNGLSGWIGGPVLVQDPSLPVRVSSVFGNPIYFPSFLVIPMFVSLYFAFVEERAWKKWMYGTLSFLMLVGVYSSGTRGAVVGLILAAALGALVYLFLTKNNQVKRYGWAGAAVLAIAVGLLFANSSKLPQGTTIYRLFNLRDTNTSARLIQWQTALEGFKDRPVVGVGAENYYIISNQYHNPEMYKYDGSWFDKPHNYILEVLVTNGIAGLVVYLGMILFVLWGMFAAFRAGLLSLGEMVVLLAGFVAYNIQNLFVFDTVSASLAFYVFVGFAGYMWTESMGTEKAKIKNVSLPSAFAPAVFVVSMAVTAYVVYTSNFIPMMLSKRINYGYAYASADPKKAVAYFESALSLPFNMDPAETAGKYSDFVGKMVRESATEDTKFAVQQIEAATVYQREVANKIGNDPISWMRLANNELLLSLLRQQPLDERNEASINKALALVPTRVELLQFKLQLRGYQNNWEDAVKIAEKMTELNPARPELRWQLALTYYQVGREEEAVRTMEAALEAGHQFTRVQEFGWFIDYYKKQGNYKRTAALYEQAVVLEPANVDLYIQLADSYAKAGDKEKASMLARQIMQSDASKKVQVEELMRSW